MSELAELFVRLEGDDGGLTKTLASAESRCRATTNVLGRVEAASKKTVDSMRRGWQQAADRVGNFKTILGSAVAALTGGVVMRSIFGEFAEDEDAARRLEAQFRRTGAQSGLTMAEIQALGKEIERTTAYGGDLVKQAQAEILMFGGIRGEVLKLAMVLSHDLAAATKTDPVAAANKLAQALLVPGEHLRGLREIGIQFSDAQIDVIQSLVDTGRAAEAQMIILGKVNQIVGGSATSDMRSFSGSWRDLTESVKDVASEFGEFLSSGIAPVLSHVKAAIDMFLNASDTVKGWAFAIGAGITVVVALAAILPVVSAGLGVVAAGMSMILTPLGLVLAILPLIAAGLVMVAGEGDTFGAKMTDVLSKVVYGMKILAFWAMNVDQLWAMTSLKFQEYTGAMWGGLMYLIENGSAALSWLSDALAQLFSEGTIIDRGPDWVPYKTEDLSARWDELEKENIRRWSEFNKVAEGDVDVGKKMKFPDVDDFKSKKGGGKREIEVHFESAAELWRRNLMDVLKPADDNKERAATATIEMAKTSEANGKATLETLKKIQENTKDASPVGA